MILATHIVVAEAVAKKLSGGNPVLGFLIGWVSHYLADTIPHVEYKLFSFGEEGIRTDLTRKEKTRDYLVVSLDALIGILVSVWLLRPTGSKELVYVLAVALGSVLPDFMQFLYKVLGFRFLKPMQDLQEFVHTKIKWRNYPVLGAISQLAVILIVWYAVR